MKKRVLSYYYANYILEQDSQYFNIPMEKLINLILRNLLYKEWRPLSNEFYSEPKEYIQFSLNKELVNMYEGYIRKNNIVNESGLLRNLLLYYASLNNFFREKLVFNDTLTQINEFIKEKKEINFEYNGKILKEVPCFISHFNTTGYICVHTEERNYELAAIKLL